MRSLIAELLGVALVAAGTFLVAGIGPALIATGALVIIGAQLYGVDDLDVDDEELEIGEANYSIRVGTG